MSIKRKTAVLVALACILVGAAQAEDSYKVYGKLHMTLELLSNSEDSQLAVSNNGSRFGLKGIKDLDKGIQMIWQFEQNVNVAQKGAETLANRNSFLGLKGTWGTMLYGIHDTPYKTMGSKITFFRDEIGDYRQTAFGWDRRLQDVVMYITPERNGFQGRAMYEVDQGTMGAAEAKTVMSGSVHYKKCGLFLGAAYEMLSSGNASSAWSDTTGSSPISNTVYGSSASGLRVGGKYVMEKIGFAFMFQNLTDYNQGSFAVNAYNSGIAVGNDKKAMTYGGEVNFKFKPGYAAKVAYYMADPDTDADDDVYNLLAFGVDRHYAKDLWFYAQYAMVMNGDASKAQLGCKCNGHGKNVSPSALGESPSGISIGMAKTF